MWKLFTRRVALLGAVVVAMTGCASVSEPSPLPSVAEASADQPLQPIDAPSPKSEALPPLPDPMALSPAAEQAVPKVERGNALAFEQAVAALRANRLREAEVLLLQITADQPELAGPWVNLGQVYVLLEQPDEARRAFTQAVAANPRSCAAHNQLGVLSRQFGDFRSAEQHYRACLLEVPNYKDAYLNLGILYELYLGKLPQALEAYRRYQLLAGEPDRRVQGWVMDLERRLGV